MIDQIRNATDLAKKDLEQLKSIRIDELTLECTKSYLQRAILHKLSIESKEEDLKDLVVLSIKASDMASRGMASEDIAKKITKYDCHQTSLVVQKKALLLIFIEKQLRIQMSDDEAVEIQDIESLSRVVFEKLLTGEHDV